MSTRDALEQLLAAMPEDKLKEILNFTRYVASRVEAEQWRQFGQAQLARAYGPNEPEYTENDLKT